MLLLVVDGSGTMVTEAGEVALNAGQIAWLPKGSRRGFLAGAAGLRYMTVHQRRQALTLTAR
ncbi:hypothetical protein M1L60_07310 [Actinoplanes sp. TRM 88003]|uniref:Uncharacterized protein n=1 Tax=Paractinoplanes aksuensis TaxID=2939490 RepID=A0ABT1DHV3_9ACTN|nr:hypothetical protein [Actinoplanes aksuensis]MCO8270402.1 hypothetical protein [Actinoplanes aksuensis]